MKLLISLGKALAFPKSKNYVFGPCFARKSAALDPRTSFLFLQGKEKVETKRKLNKKRKIFSLSEHI